MKQNMTEKNMPEEVSYTEIAGNKILVNNVNQSN
jgi:hypothetical protein